MTPIAEFFASPQYLWAAAAGVFGSVTTGTITVWFLIHRHEAREFRLAAERAAAEERRHSEVIAQLQAAIKEASRFPALVAAQYQRVERKVTSMDETLRKYGDRLRALEKLRGIDYPPHT